MRDPIVLIVEYLPQNYAAYFADLDLIDLTWFDLDLVFFENRDAVELR